MPTTLTITTEERMVKEKPLRLTLRVDISAEEPGAFPHRGSLHIEEAFHLSPRGYLDLCRVLGQFHDLAQKIGSEA